MSKAFTKESSDADDDEPINLPPVARGKNYVTPEGFDRLKNELLQLMKVERPKVVEVVHWAASNGDRSENGDYLYGKKRLREIDRRIRFLTKRLDCVERVDCSVHRGSDRVFFGAIVTYADHTGEERVVRILGIDEADHSKGEITWISPLAQALLGSRVGDQLRVETPGGTNRIEVVDVRYP